MRSPSRAEDPQYGLVFDFLADAPDVGGHKVMTGHEDDLIAINLCEADAADVQCQENHAAMIGPPFGAKERVGAI